MPFARLIPVTFTDFSVFATCTFQSSKHFRYQMYCKVPFETTTNQLSFLGTSQRYHHIPLIYHCLPFIYLFQMPAMCTKSPPKAWSTASVDHQLPSVSSDSGDPNIRCSAMGGVNLICFPVCHVYFFVRAGAKVYRQSL